MGDVGERVGEPGALPLELLGGQGEALRELAELAGEDGELPLAHVIEPGRAIAVEPLVEPLGEPCDGAVARDGEGAQGERRGERAGGDAEGGRGAGHGSEDEGERGGREDGGGEGAREGAVAGEHGASPLTRGRGSRGRARSR